MALLGSWSFERRLAAGLLLPTALTALMAGVAARSVSTLVSGKNRLLDASGAELIAVDKARLVEARRTAAARGFLLTGNPHFRRSFEQDDRNFIAALRAYKDLDATPETSKLIDGVLRNYDEYRAEFRTTVGLKQAGKSLPSVVRRYETVVEPQREQVDRIISALVGREAAQFQDERARSDLATFRTTLMLYSVAGVLVLMGLTLTATVSRTLARAHAQAAEAARARGELKASQAAYKELQAVSYAISHNLRAPLRTIDAAARSALSSGGVSGERERSALEAARASVTRMSGLIESLLELLGVASAPMRRQPVDLSALFSAAFEARAGAAPGRPRFRVEPGLRCDADPALLRLALDKLVDNAVKFSARVPQPDIEAGETLVAGERAFFLRDNGAGFDMAHAERLFVPFQRLHRPDEFPGVGMGLPVVARIIERHGGRVWARAVVGGGAAFYFTLP